MLKNFYNFKRFVPYLERACFRSKIPDKLNLPRIILYLIPGKSFTRPPRTKTSWKRCKLCPSPGI